MSDSMENSAVETPETAVEAPGSAAAGMPERKRIAFTRQQIEDMKSAVCELEAVDEINSYTEVIEKLRPTIGKMKRKGVKLEQIHALLKERFGLDCTLRTFKNCLACSPKERRGRRPKEAAPVRMSRGAQVLEQAAAAKAQAEKAPEKRHEPAQQVPAQQGEAAPAGTFTLDDVFPDLAK